VYGYETWSLTVKKEHGLKVFENRVLTGIFISKRDQIIGGWRKLRDEELHNLHSSPNMIRMIKSMRIRWAEQVACMGEKECIQGFGGKARSKETTRKT
jgi:hypothetical protein